MLKGYFSKILLIVFLFGIFKVEAAELWVATNGDNTNPGTKEKPLASVQMALRKARELRRLNDASIKEGITIYVGEGVYEFYEPLLIRPEDSGTEDSPTRIVAKGENKPIFSGGVKVENWEKFSGNLSGLPKNAEVWVADAPKVGGQPLNFRQLWVNDKKAVWATSLNDGKLDRILSVDNEEQAFWIPTPDADFNNLDDLEFVIHQWWAIANLRVKGMEVQGDKTKISFHQPESLIEFEHPWPAPFIDENNEYNGNSAFFFQGARELLTKPGEWYHDKEEGKLYYWPRKDENLNNAEVVAPFLESLVEFKGDLDNPVKHFTISGIAFQHTTWMRPSERGHVPLQAGWYILEAYKLKEPGTPDKESLENQAWIGRQPGGIEISNASHINIENCQFQHMAATGLDLVTGVSDTRIQGNLFRDIGGTGIQAGFFGGPDFEAHLPYNPKDEREIVKNIQIKNNLITDATNEDWGCVGISVGFAQGVNIEHNEINDINYSGICVGWGWTKTISASKNNRVHANKIHNFAKQMYDVGGIYTLSAQPNMEITENVIYNLNKAPYAHMLHHHQYIYFDEASSYIRVQDNWTERAKFFCNTPGPGNEWFYNGPKVSEEIKNKAGLEPEFQQLLER